jgi:N-acetylglucosaminyldiphosphoundecaprenol N-acetyl-beta-D-mannosaminyltransferase
MKEIRILEVTVHDVDRSHVREWFTQALRKQGSFFVVTPNPEILLHAHRHNAYADVLSRADLALPDGRGLRMVSPLNHTTTGVDAARDLLSIANEHRLRVCCVIRADGRSTAEETQQSVAQMAVNATVEVVPVAKGEWENPGAAEAASRFAADIVLVGLGFPEQELWLDRHLQQIPTAHIGMAVGGAFDFWTGVAKRAPHFVRRVGLEWLWRLAHEPRRWKRIWNAVVVFPLTVLRYRKPK